MGDNNISEKLKALSQGKNRSATARLREIFVEIEAALRSGVRRKDVHQALSESGFEITFESFELAIYRIRKEGSKQNTHTAGPRPTDKPAAALPPISGNPLRVLTGKLKDGDHNPIPTAKFEVDKS
jgi:hypothetical protein